MADCFVIRSCTLHAAPALPPPSRAALKGQLQDAHWCLLHRSDHLKGLALSFSRVVVLSALHHHRSLQKTDLFHNNCIEKSTTVIAGYLQSDRPPALPQPTAAHLLAAPPASKSAPLLLLAP